MKLPIAIAIAALLLVVGPISVHAVEIELTEVVSGLRRPIGMAAPGDGTGRLFIVEQAGRIRILDGGALLDTPFLDLSGSVSCCDERGLLGLAFHPDFASNGFFFVNYTDRGGDTVVSRFSISTSDPDLADSASEVEVLSYRQPFSNHNGGHIAFGPDGYLYIASGDGGAGGDPQNNAQDLTNLLGKILRIDVDASPVAIPPDNPFVGRADAAPEIWSYGLRNPWRFSFDRETGDLFIGDVGQNAIEEIDFQPASSAGGENYGWRRMEGTLCFNPSSNCDDGSLVLPILEYGHTLGCSVTGGFRYRGVSAPGLVGVYFFGDFCSGRIWAATESGTGEWSAKPVLDTDLGVASFGEDSEGELYVVSLGGGIYRLTSSAFFRNGFETGNFSGWKKKGKPSIVSPGLDGTAFALSVSADAGRPRVRTRSPDAERELTVELTLDPSGLEQLVLEEAILLLSDGRGEHVEVTLERRGSKYRLALYVEEADGRRRIGRTKISRKKPTRIGLSWRAASDGARDGRASLLKKGRERAARSNLDTSGRRVKQLEAGFPLGTKGGSGELLLDEFVLSR